MSLKQQADSHLLAGAAEIVKSLRAHGEEAFFAGGAVRDLLLGKPIREIDIATSALPDTIESLFEKTVSVGKQFGVIVVVMDSRNYEVTTFRREGEYLDGRHPSRVSFTDAEEDVRRRDFTINALLLDPSTEEVVDYVSGREDLSKGLIRTVGPPEQRFSEDKLRLLRALRFACQLGFQIEAGTYQSLCRFASQLNQVSWERIRDELLKILTGPDPSRGLRLMMESGVLAVILPEAAAMAGVEQPPEYHPEGDVFQHTCLMFELSRDLSEVLALAVLLHDIGKPPTFTVKERIRFDGHVEVGAEMGRKICQRLRIPNQMTEEVVDLILHHLRFMHVQEMRESTLKRFLRKENFDKHLELHRLDCLGSHGDLTSYEFCRRKLEEFTLEALRPLALLTGNDLLEMGLEPGPIFSEILTGVEDLQLEGNLHSREEALEWVRRHWGDRLGGRP